MPVQIDKLETSVEFTPPRTASTPREQPVRVEPAANAASMRDAFLQFLGDEFDAFSRMRGH